MNDFVVSFMNAAENDLTEKEMVDAYVEIIDVSNAIEGDKIFVALNNKLYNTTFNNAPGD